MPAIEAERLDFSFGALRVLREVSLSVEQGSTLCVFGPNGAGKTTLLRLLAGLLRPDTGQVRIVGIELAQDSAGFRRSIGVLSHHPYVYPRLTGRENLEYYGRMYRLQDPRAEAARVLGEMGLADAKDREAATYSRGMLQRLAIGRALLHRPRVLLLDEPFTGLDDQAQGKLQALLNALRDGERTVVMTTHDVGSGLGLADHVAVLVRGSIGLEVPAAGLEPGTFIDHYRRLTAPVEERRTS
jgi:heme exporter protein A